MIQPADDSRIEELLLQWEDARARGRCLEVADLCPDRPDLAREIARRIAALRRLGSALERDVATPDACSGS